MLYILDHYYLTNHEASCLVIEIEQPVSALVEICSAISFLLEDLTDVSNCLDEKCLLKCLEQFYGACNVKDNITIPALKMLQLPIDFSYEEAYLTSDKAFRARGNIFIDKEYNSFIIDLYEARESCCGPSYKELMDKWLPKDNLLEDMKKILLTENNTTD